MGGLVKLTHAVTVLGYIFCQDQLLLLKRNYAPRIYAPPGGRLLINEPPMMGLQREIREESGLDQVPIGPIMYLWHGRFHPRSPQLLCAGYLCPIPRFMPVRLSHEHSAYAWTTLDEIQSARFPTMDGPWGIELSFYQSAFSLYRDYRISHPDSD